MSLNVLAKKAIRCPVMSALLRSRALRKAEKYGKRANRQRIHVCGLGCSYLSNQVSTMQTMRQRIARVLAARLDKFPQKSEITQREFEGMNSRTYEISNQKTETRKSDSASQKSDTMISRPYVDFLSIF